MEDKKPTIEELAARLAQIAKEHDEFERTKKTGAREYSDAVLNGIWKTNLDQTKQKQ